ncbi:hypothetical protein BH09VER1_BH09VER1_14020 [soil metagenome]
MKRGAVEVIESKGVKIPIYRGLHHGKQSYLIAYYADGKRIRERTQTLEDARQQAKAKIKDLTMGSAHVGTLTLRQTAAVMDAIAILKDINTPLSQMAREYAEARKILNGHGTVVDAARLFTRETAKREIPRRTFAQVVEEFRASIATAGLSILYQRDCRVRLARAARAFHAQIMDIKPEDIDAWLSLGKRSPRAVNNDRTTLVTLFEFAKSKGYLPRDLETAAKQSIKRKAIDSEIQILTPENFALLLKHTPKKFIPFVAIGGFAGVRSAEIFRMDWAEIDFSQGHIEIKAAKAKTASRRIVPLLPALRAWIEPLAEYSGPLWDYGKLEGFLNAWSKCKPHLPVKVPVNSLRHSYASYRLAVVNDAQKVALEMGNSPRKLFENYRQLVTPAAAEKWFETFPESHNRKHWKKLVETP